MAAAHPPIVLYHYPTSPFAKRIVWYLNLRQIPYSQCLQPVILPRPDLKEELGISYRRIPILSIGRDVYLDTRLILAKLEQLFPPSPSHPSLTTPSPLQNEHALLSALLSRTIIAPNGLFLRAAQLLPPKLFAAPGNGTPQFLRDRADLSGVNLPPSSPSSPNAAADVSASPLSPATLAARRPEALVEIRAYAALLERTVFSDGRPWIVKGAGGPTLLDIEAVWILHWLRQIPGALPAGYVDSRVFPGVFAWVERFGRAAEQRPAGEAAAVVQGAEAASLIAGSAFAEAEAGVDAADPVVLAEGLGKGVQVRMWPTDWGFTHKDTGTLVGVDDAQFVVEVKGKRGTVRVHAPRRGFKVAKVGEGESRL